MSSSEVTSGIRENILVSGSLKNSCVLASCIVRAVKITIPGLETAEYVQAEVALSPPYVPDGDYELYFEDQGAELRWCLDLGGPASDPAERSSVVRPLGRTLTAGEWL